MAISSYFYDSVNGDRPYSANDFARAFGIFLQNGVLLNDDGTTGLDVGGTNYTTIYEGKAIVQGHFIEVTGTESLVVPTGTYDGQIVLQMDAEDKRTASFVVKVDRTPVQTSSFYELPLYNVVVTNGVIGTVSDLRKQGGLQNSVKWIADTNGVRCNMGKFGGTGKDVVLFLTSAQPSASPTEHRVWIQIDNF